MAISALGIRPEAALKASASKFDPRPESRTPMRFFMQGEISTITLAHQKMKAFSTRRN
jgi:hypothetical protein